MAISNRCCWLSPGTGDHASDNGFHDSYHCYRFIAKYFPLMQINIIMVFASALYILITQKFQTVVSALAVLIPALGLSYYMGNDNQSWLFFAGILFMNIVTMVMRL
jgi:hypothetical protein